MMRISISNIAWTSEKDDIVYRLMEKCGFSGLEIAPTRIFSEKPYDDLKSAQVWKEGIFSQYGFEISSMQSIWFGRSEKLFGTEDERNALMSYTKQAVDFAEVIGCGNIVFGCPRNRSILYGGDIEVAVRFFRTLGDYALDHHTVIAMEANPPIYNTNFINNTMEAIELIERVNSKGFLLNLDVGTMVENGEEVGILRNKNHLINHVHISEPGLKPIQKRKLHSELAEMLRDTKYEGFVSVEVGKQENVDILADMMKYVKSVFGG